MSIMQLHEDSPIAEYTQFPIIELDFDTFQTLGGTFNSFTNTSPIEGTALILRISDSIDLYNALSVDCPRNVLQNGSIIKNKNYWENVQGVYTRADTVIESVPIGQRPADWGSSSHYYTQSLNTPSAETPHQYVIYNHVSPTATYDSSTQYYKDISSTDKKMCRKFYTDAGVSFSCFCAASYTRNRSAQKYINACSHLGYAYNYSYYYTAGDFWTYNSNPFSPTTNSQMAMVGETVYPDSTDGASKSPTIRTWAGLETIVPSALCFIHTKYNDVDYYGIAYLEYDSDTDTALPTTLFALVLSIEYWGDSIKEGGVIPSGSWGPTSGQSGGSGSWDNTDDSASINVPLPIASLPNALTVGGLHAYLMTESMLDKLSGLMYNPTTFNNFWSKWLNQKFNPISGIISIHKLPFALQPTGTETFVRIAGAVLDATYMSDLGACLGDLISSQYTETPEYTVSLPEYFGSFYDYDPYTKCYLHLPACGIIKISANEILAGSVSVKYRCDIITGNVCAIVKTTDRNNVVKTHFVTGNCAYKMPFIGRDDGGVDNLVSLISGGISLISGNVAGVIGAGKAIAEREHSTTITGDCTGNLTPLSDLKLWLEVVRVVPSTPENKQEMQGIPANVYTSLYDISGTGYAEIDTIHLGNIPDATQEEIVEIENILKNGAVF